MPLLVLGSKNHSSWSLRAWLFLRKVGFEFTERVIAFDAPGYQREIALLSPSGKVPLEHGGGWLSGEFSMADAMFAPVLFRFQTYGAELGPNRAPISSMRSPIRTCATGLKPPRAEKHVLPAVDDIGKK